MHPTTYTQTNLICYYPYYILVPCLCIFKPYHIINFTSLIYVMIQLVVESGQTNDKWYLVVASFHVSSKSQALTKVQCCNSTQWKQVLEKLCLDINFFFQYTHCTTIARSRHQGTLATRMHLCWLL